MMFNLKVGPHPEVPDVVQVELGDLAVAFVPGSSGPGENADRVAYAFARYGAVPTPRRIRRDAGPNGVGAYLKRHQDYFDDMERRDAIAESLTPLITEALVAYRGR